MNVLVAACMIGFIWLSIGGVFYSPLFIPALIALAIAGTLMMIDMMNW